jgi:beta-lactamase superfamily II metal-dependent hydrolase
MKTTPLAVSLLLLCSGYVRADQKTRTLDFHWIDSEGGGSTLIVTPAGESVLIDTGNPGGRDAGRIVAAAKEAGLTRIDHVVITHWHIDHFGGAAEVAQAMPVGTIHAREIPAGDPDGRKQSPFPTQIRPFREIAGVTRATLRAGTTIPLRRTDGAPAPVLRCIAADQQLIEPTPAQKARPNPRSAGEEKPADTSDNANSAVFVLEFGGFRFFDGGDLTWNVERRLVSPHALPGAVDVYQTNHHGLESSNNPLLVQSLEPTVVVMNNGPKKGGQAGSFAAIRSAASVQALYQVHRSFNVPEETNAPHAHIANHGNLTGPEAAKCPAHRIVLRVAPDGKSYTVDVPATGHSRTFATQAR